MHHAGNELADLCLCNVHYDMSPLRSILDLPRRMSKTMDAMTIAIIIPLLIVESSPFL